MPSLPRSPFGRRSARARAAAAELAIEQDQPRAEMVEAPGLRWINIERPRSADQEWLEERFDFHPLDYEDVLSRNQRPKVDEYDDYLFIVLHFPRYDKSVGRLNAAEVDLFVGPDYLITIPNEPLQPLEYLFERCRTNEEVRENLFSKGPAFLLYRIVDELVDSSFPMLRKIGNKLERIEEEIFEGNSAEVVRDISNVKQEIINFRKVVRPQRAAIQDLERNKARLHRRGLRRLLRGHQRRFRACVGHARELQGGRGGAREHERIADRPPDQRGVPGPDRDLRDRPPAHARGQHLGHEREGPRRGQPTAFFLVLGLMLAMLVGLILYFRRRGWL